MSRVWDAAQDAGFLGEWRRKPCPRCAGDNQRVATIYRGEDEITEWWFGSRSDNLCSLCRCEHEAEEQEAEMREHMRIAEQAERQA